MLYIFKLGSKQREWVSIPFTFEYNNHSFLVGETIEDAQ